MKKLATPLLLLLFLLLVVVAAAALWLKDAEPLHRSGDSSVTMGGPEPVQVRNVTTRELARFDFDGGNRPVSPALRSAG